jgi:hypothetical protein
MYNENILTKKFGELEKRISALEMLAGSKTTSKKTSKISILDHLNNLKSKAFFDDTRTVKEITEKLAEKGYHYPGDSLSHPLQIAIRKGILGRIKKNGIWAYCKR